MQTAKDNLLDWLRDAHAAEEQAKTMLSGTAGRVKSYPALKDRIEAHIDETARHAKLVQQCIESLGGSTSMFKDTGGKLMATAQSLSGYFVSDEVVKAVLATYTFEAMEIASYSIIRIAAEQIGDVRTVNACDQILRDEEAMAGWLKENIPAITRQYLTQEAKAA
jgi:ferritin-like metal-binding protein YciE